MMDTTRISKINKSKIYADERSERIDFHALEATVKGDNNGVHRVSYNNGAWQCDCDYYQSRHEVCTHIMTLERVLTNMVELAA
ncbi:MAG: hypothetical protein KC425_13275 [Anaerolineales bacterium]|nr:hypothetical protein [Anaerolineales bacterium]